MGLKFFPALPFLLLGFGLFFYYGQKYLKAASLKDLIPEDQASKVSIIKLSIAINFLFGLLLISLGVNYILLFSIPGFSSDGLLILSGIELFFLFPMTIGFKQLLRPKYKGNSWKSRPQKRTSEFDQLNINVLHPMELDTRWFYLKKRFIKILPYVFAISTIFLILVVFVDTEFSIKNLLLGLLGILIFTPYITLLSVLGSIRKGYLRDKFNL